MAPARGVLMSPCRANIRCRDLLVGAAALEFVLAQEPRLVILLGFDGGVVPGSLIYFDDTRRSEQDDGATAGRWTCWPWLAERARDAGVRVVNCSPGTLIEAFELGGLDGELASAESSNAGLEPDKRGHGGLDCRLAPVGVDRLIISRSLKDTKEL